MKGMPRPGTLYRTVFDAMHAIYCGPECEDVFCPGAPGHAEVAAAITAVMRWQNQHRRGSKQKGSPGRQLIPLPPPPVAESGRAVPRA